MPKRPIEGLGAATREKRGSRKLRETAQEIGISPATLMRVENGRVPDLLTFGKLCRWLSLDPNDFLGVPRGDTPKTTEPAGPLVMSAHFRADAVPLDETVRALAMMLLTAAGEERKVKGEADRDDSA